MIKAIRFMLLCSLLVGTFAGQKSNPNPANAQHTSPYHYAYVYQIPLRGKVVIKAVDPTYLTRSTQLYMTTLPDDAALYGALVSPDGQWIVLIPDVGGQSLRLVDVATGETRDIAGILGLSHEFTGRTLLGQPQPLAWSPDGQALAFTAFLIGQSSMVSDVFVYNVTGDTLVKLSNTPTRQQAVAWSPDSRYLASGGIACHETDCFAQVDIFDRVTQTRTVSQTVAPAYQMSYEGTICQLSWSPDAHYLSLVSSCDVAMQGVDKELFLLDRVQGTVHQLTNYTQTAIQAPNAPGDYPLRWGIYDTGWLDADTFFLGETFAQTDVSNLTSQTVRYDVDTGERTILRADMMAEAWTPNPVYDQFAFRTASGYPNGRTYHNVEIASVEAGTLSTVGSGPAGCNLAWTPDGSTLAYTGHEQRIENCSGPVRVLYFMDATTGQLISYPLAETGDVRAGGWIKNQPDVFGR
ncbi:MAG: PD40 domain-containing protein [Anaerolineae bacterium]|nr:PD40 domain-containing protein [Anaerolineae bacterium]